MFRKLVIIAMVMCMAGMALAVTIGNPTSSNSWSTTKYVAATNLAVLHELPDVGFPIVTATSFRPCT